MDAVVLAAGLGKRLAPRTEVTPKCLIDAGGLPLIDRVLDRLAPLPFGCIGVTAFHLKQQVVDHFAGANPDSRIRVIQEERLLGTGGGLRNALAAMPPVTSLLVHNCDIVSDMNLEALLAAHDVSGADATLAVQRRLMPRSLAFDVNGQLLGRSCSMGSRSSGSWFAAEFCGVHVLGPRMAGFIRERSHIECLIDLLVQASSSELKVRGFDIGPALWMDLGTPENLAEFECSVLRTNRTSAPTLPPA